MAWVAQLYFKLQVFNDHKQYLYPLAIGVTAVGPGLNTHPKFAKKVIVNLSGLTNMPFTQADNKFSALATHNPLVEMSGALSTCAETC